MPRALATQSREDGRFLGGAQFEQLPDFGPHEPPLLPETHVHNGKGNDIKKPAVPTDDDIIQGIKASGRYNATVGSETHARRLLQQAMPDGVELPAAVAGQPYPNPPLGVKKWYQLQPSEPDVGHILPHFKYADWTGGKKGRGGSWGHIFFLPPTP